MKINKLSGLPLQIYIPNSQTTQPFEFEFYTNPSAPSSSNLSVSFDGSRYNGCSPWEKGVYLYSEHKFSNAGPLYCRATYTVPNPTVEGGFQKIVMDKLSTDIEIVSEGGDYFDPIPNPAKLPIPSFNDPCCTHLPVFMTFYPTSITKVSGIDKSLTTEQLIEGEFFVDRDGARKQVYGKRISLSGKLLDNSNSGGIIFNNVLTNISSILSVEGFATIPYVSEGSLTAVAFVQFNGAYIKNEQYNINIAFCSESPFWGNNTVNPSITVNDSRAIGMTAKLDVFIKYMKL